MNTIKDYGLNERILSLALQYRELRLARVIAQHKGFYQLATETGEYRATLAGGFRRELVSLTQYPAVGDYVMALQATETDAPVIQALLPRTSVFTRRAVGTEGQKQVVAANVDVVFLCMSLNQNFSLNRLERYLAAAWSSGATPVVLLTKADLCPDLPHKLAQARAVSGCAEVLTLSAFDKEAQAKLLSIVRPGITASFIGSSGVGKSTLVNLLMGTQAQATSDIGWQDKGRHTTTGREMLALPNGGVVIDTPGMRELGLDDADTETVFADIEALAAACRFGDCTHTAEPGCAVLQALAEGTLDSRRLDSHRKLKKEAAYEGLSSRKLEETKLNDMFQQAGGMKNARRYIRENDKRRK